MLGAVVGHYCIMIIIHNYYVYYYCYYYIALIMHASSVNLDLRAIEFRIC